MAKKKNDNNSAAYSQDAANARDIADHVNFLFQYCRKPNNDRYSYAEVEELTGGKIHNSWISKLASGNSPRPGLWSLKALTDFFGVEPSFWFNPLTDELKTKVIEHQNAAVSKIALRSGSLSPAAQKIVLDLIDSLERSGMSDIVEHEKKRENGT